MELTNAIEIKDLYKDFGDVQAVRGVSLEIEAGSVFSLLGPNGAGKSTTIKMLTGLLVPSGGELQVNGFVPWRERKQYVARIGAV